MDSLWEVCSRLTRTEGRVADILICTKPFYCVFAIADVSPRGSGLTVFLENVTLISFLSPKIGCIVLSSSWTSADAGPQGRWGRGPRGLPPTFNCLSHPVNPDLSKLPLGHIKASNILVFITVHILRKKLCCRSGLI